MHTAQHKTFYIHSYIHTYIHSFIHTYIAILQSHLFKIHINVLHTYTHTYTYIHTYCIHTVHTYIHTHIHTYIHAYHSIKTIHTTIILSPAARAEPDRKGDEKRCQLCREEGSEQGLSFPVGQLDFFRFRCMYVCMYVCLYTITTLSLCM